MCGYRNISNTELVAKQNFLSRKNNKLTQQVRFLVLGCGILALDPCIIIDLNAWVKERMVISPSLVPQTYISRSLCGHCVAFWYRFLSRVFAEQSSARGRSTSGVFKRKCETQSSRVFESSRDSSFTQGRISPELFNIKDNNNHKGLWFKNCTSERHRRAP